MLLIIKFFILIWIYWLTSNSIIFISAPVVTPDCRKNNSCCKRSVEKNNYLKNNNEKGGHSRSLKDQILIELLNNNTPLDEIDQKLGMFINKHPTTVRGISAIQHIKNNSKTPSISGLFHSKLKILCDNNHKELNFTSYPLNWYNIVKNNEDDEEIKKLSEELKKRKLGTIDDLSDECKVILMNFNNGCSITNVAIDYAALNIIDRNRKFQSKKKYVYIPVFMASEIMEHKTQITKDSEINFMKLKGKILIMTTMIFGSHWVSLVLDTNQKIAEYFDSNYPTMKGNIDDGVERLQTFLTAIEDRNKYAKKDYLDTKDWNLIAPKMKIHQSSFTKNGCGLYCIAFMDATINNGKCTFPGSINEYREQMQIAVLYHMRTNAQKICAKNIS